MLTPTEHKVVISTLTKRRAWLRKALEDRGMDKAAREEHIESAKLLDSALQKLARMADTAPKPSPSGATANKKAKSVKILVAEDNPDSANLLMELLQDLGYRDVDLATNGKQAFDKIKASADPYNVILCDWDMPELTGLEVHSKAKASNTLRNAHFMMVTAVSEAARIREAIQQGVKDYIIKPIDIEVLEGKIKAALANQENP